MIYAQSVPHHFNDKKDAYDVNALVTCHTNLGALSTEVDADNGHDRLDVVERNEGDEGDEGKRLSRNRA